MPKIIQTEDGSHTLLSSQFEVSYHSIHGAIQETQTVFINAALRHKALTNNNLSILDIGFGTGLNAFMTYLEAQKSQLNIQYTGVEAYPISMDIAEKLNYAALLDAHSEQENFLKLHRSENTTIQVSPTFHFQKKISLFQDLDYNEVFDIIYYDAFAPTAQPELWEEPILSKMYQALKPDGVFVTYCAKGVFKRCLKSVGFRVEGLAGPVGKREMTRAFR